MQIPHTGMEVRIGWLENAGHACRENTPIPGPAGPQRSLVSHEKTTGINVVKGKLVHAGHHSDVT